MRSDRDRLLDILAAIEKIERRMPVTHEDFDKDEDLQVWVGHHVMVIGEAVRAMSADLRKRYPGLPWRQIIAMRNILVHEYFATDPNEIWLAITRDIPPLRRAVEAILRESGGTE